MAGAGVYRLDDGGWMVWQSGDREVDHAYGLLERLGQPITTGRSGCVAELRHRAMKQLVDDRASGRVESGDGLGVEIVTESGNLGRSELFDVPTEIRQERLDGSTRNRGHESVDLVVDDGVHRTDLVAAFGSSGFGERVQVVHVRHGSAE